MKTKAPTGLRAAGRALWRAVTDEYDLAAHEVLLLREACRTADVLDELARVVADEGAMDTDGRAHPAAVEGRQQRLVLARLLASLRVPDPETGVREQRRGAVRGVYGQQGAS